MSRAARRTERVEAVVAGERAVEPCGGLVAGEPHWPVRGGTRDDAAACLHAWARAETGSNAQISTLPLLVQAQRLRLRELHSRVMGIHAARLPDQLMKPS